MKIENVWDFVEKYYPNYYQCNHIAENDDLHKLFDGQMEKGSGAERLYNDIRDEAKIMWNGCDEETLQAEIDKEIENRKNASDADIFERAIEGFIESQKIS